MTDLDLASVHRMDRMTNGTQGGDLLGDDETSHYGARLQTLRQAIDARYGLAWTSKPTVQAKLVGFLLVVSFVGSEDQSMTFRIRHRHNRLSVVDEVKVKGFRKSYSLDTRAIGIALPDVTAEILRFPAPAQQPQHVEAMLVS